jgi:hypothetical protein
LPGSANSIGTSTISVGTAAPVPISNSTRETIAYATMKNAAVARWTSDSPTSNPISIVTAATT